MTYNYTDDPKPRRRQVEYHPAWLPRYDYGHWNERWGTHLRPLRRKPAFAHRQENLT